MSSHNRDQTGKAPWVQLNELAEASSPEAKGLYFFRIVGERSPIWDPEAKGYSSGWIF